MTNILALSGNEAGARALKQVNPDVAAVFPITPQTELMHAFAQFVADGEVDTELITVESEHSAMSATVGASAAGSRAITATSANGLALMWEIVYIAASSRLPIVMPVINRALSGPINIHCDHSDTMGCRDTGWIQIYSENAQEAYENIIQAFRIAEHKDVLLPVMVMQDGFITSHAVESVKIYDDKDVKNFVGAYNPYKGLLDTENPYTFGPLDLQDYYFEHKQQQLEAIERSKKVILEIGKEFSEKFKTQNYSFFEEYKLKDAEAAIVVMSSTAGTAKCVVDRMREEGYKVGLLKPRVFRPFPAKEMAKALEEIKGITVMDRCASFGAYGGPLFNELRSAVYENEKKPLIKSVIFGLGGRDINEKEIRDIYIKLLDDIKNPEKAQIYSTFGVRR